MKKRFRKRSRKKPVRALFFEILAKLLNLIVDLSFQRMEYKLRIVLLIFTSIIRKVQKMNSK